MSETRRPETRPLRVALIAHLSEVSGGGVALLEVARGLDRDRFEPLFLLPGHGPLQRRAQEAGAEAVVVENREEGFGPSLLGKVILAGERIRYVLRLARYFRREKVDLVYVNSAVSVFAGLAARLAGGRIVWHVHETFDSPSRAARVKMALIERLAEGILYASKSAEHCFPAQRVRHRLVVQNRVPVQEIAGAEPLRAEELASLQVPEGTFLILANGLFPRKGPDLLLRAFKQLVEKRPERLHLLLTGDAPLGAGEYAEGLGKFVEREGLEGKVTFSGLRRDMARLLRSADLFVSASRNEALPIAILEAMAAGTPVVATDVGDCARVLEGGRFGAVVPPEDGAALAEAVGWVLDDRTAAAARAELAQEAVMREYGGADFWKPLEEFLEKVAGERRG